MSKLRTWLNTSVILIATLGLGLVASGCDSNDPSPDTSEIGDVTGAITGQVIDNATNEPIEGATVVAAVGSLDTDAESFSATTGSEGRFAITDLPATTADDGSNTGEDPSARYGIRVETPEGSAYRSAYRGEVELAFGNNETGAIELGANITFPLSKTNGSLSGQLGVSNSNSDAPLRNTELRLSQDVNVEFDADGDATTGNSSLSVVTTTTTDEQGAFSVENLVVGEDVDVDALFDDGTEQNVGSQSIPDEGDAAPLEESVSAPALEIVDVTPDPETDIDVEDARPSFVFTFNRPVADNRTVNSLAENEELLITTQSPAQKSLTSNGDIKVETSFNEDRTELTVTPTQDLSDGFRYEHTANVSASDFTDAQYGESLSSTSDLDIEFTVGLDNSAPAAPSISVQPSALNDDGEIAAGTYGYTDGQVASSPLHRNKRAIVPLQVDEVDNSQAEVKGYEVFYSSQDIRENRGANSASEFQQVGEYERSAVGSQLPSGDFEVSENIVDASEAEFNNGRLTFSASTNDNNPFAAQDGSYGDIEVKVRAVSINNERSAFSETLTIADTDSLSLVENSTRFEDTNGDGDDNALVVEFDEPVSGISVGDDGTNYFAINDGSGTATSLGNVEEVENRGVNTGPGATVTVALDDDGSNTGNDELTVKRKESNDDFVTDLAGNPIEVGDGDEDVDDPDDNQDFTL
ncbi:carboxypeptidase-like regulatory domain-containing protein [Salinibacter altiplanensis]|uniref:carboxypeptidase-like regulatory domain-containing protein n=1 Tax=Salinibacter altiplanensis TaxID=1803181 RepID=UPI0012FFF188|nr:carboxypeptidase-like regulatory domain-containing protein [Salinibacter altiplanensis]